MSGDRIRIYEFIAKYIGLSIAGFWTLVIGTDFIDKRIKETDLAKAQFELNSLQLGKDGLYPTADHVLRVRNFGTNEMPIYGEFDVTDSESCYLTGQYVITNDGPYLIKIDTVTFEVFAKPIVSPQTAKASENGISSFSLSPSIEVLDPILREEMNVSEMLATGNRLERSFGYLIYLEEPRNYVIKASATGGLAGANELSKEISQFHKNDLTHISGAMTICPLPMLSQE